MARSLSKLVRLPIALIMRANGQPLYTLTNPVDDAITEITHVLRGEDLLSSTPRQIVLYRALLELGIAKVMPEYGHLPYVMGEGNREAFQARPRSKSFAPSRTGHDPGGAR